MPKTRVVSIVDDDESIRTAISSLVRSIGCESLVFKSGDAFVDSGYQSHSDCIITDVQMPGMSGIDLQHFLYLSGNTTPIIFVTAFEDANAKDLATQRGAVCFLTKPFDADTLLNCIELAFNHVRSHRL